MAKRTKPRAGLPRRYTFKLYPSREQAEEMDRQCRMVGDLWNALLQRQEDTYRRWLQRREGRKRLTFFDMTAEITQLRHACPGWADLSVWTAHRVANALDEAFKAFFRRAKEGAGGSAGYPQFRPFRRQNWLPHRCQSGFKMRPIERDTTRQYDWSVRLKAVPGEMRARGEFPSAPLAWGDVDIRRDEAGVWWLSVQVDQPADRRGRGQRERTVRFDLIDRFVTLDGMEVPAWTFGLNDDATAYRIAALQQQMSELRAQQDWEQYREIKRRLARVRARERRQRREALHEWTTNVIRGASRLTIIRPPDIKGDTATGRGDARAWGAAVEVKAEMNRHVLAQAPAAAIAMLVYKAAEAGIECDVQAAPEILAAGQDAVRTAKQVRRLRRQIKKEAA